MTTDERSDHSYPAALHPRCLHATTCRKSLSPRSVTSSTVLSSHNPFLHIPSSQCIVTCLAAHPKASPRRGAVSILSDSSLRQAGMCRSFFCADCALSSFRISVYLGHRNRAVVTRSDLLCKSDRLRNPYRCRPLMCNLEIPRSCRSQSMALGSTFMKSSVMLPRTPFLVESFLVPAHFLPSLLQWQPACSRSVCKTKVYIPPLPTRRTLFTPASSPREIALSHAQTHSLFCFWQLNSAPHVHRHYYIILSILSSEPSSPRFSSSAIAEYVPPRLPESRKAV